MPAPRDPFRTLALPYDATVDDIRQAFRRRARQTHPDRGGTAEAFHEVRVAYGLLAADLEGVRRRWQPAPAAPPRAAALPDPRAFPTCPVRIHRGRDGRRVVAYDVERRPSGWQPGRVPPSGGALCTRVAATAASPAVGVWAVPLDADRVRYVFGPPGA